MSRSTSTLRLTVWIVSPSNLFLLRRLRQEVRPSCQMRLDACLAGQFAEMTRTSNNFGARARASHLPIRQMEARGAYGSVGLLSGTPAAAVVTTSPVLSLLSAASSGSSSTTTIWASSTSSS